MQVGLSPPPTQHQTLLIPAAPDTGVVRSKGEHGDTTLELAAPGAVTPAASLGWVPSLPREPV